MPEGITIRNLLRGDAADVAKLARLAPGVAGWALDSYERLGSLGLEGWVAEIGGAVAGFLVTRLVATDLEVLNLATGVEFRRRGVATALVAKCLEASRERGADKAFLEVRESNHAAISLYERFGFNVSGLREQYYRNPLEDAVLMTRVLPEKTIFPLAR